MQKSLVPQFQITATSVFVPHESSPERNHYFFAYKIKIKNAGTVSAQLMSRHWIITDSIGRTEEVRGPGVVGLQPKIPPGQVFEYESACPLSTPSGSMKGSYQMNTEQGQNIVVEIPEFYLISPQALN